MAARDSHVDKDLEVRSLPAFSDIARWLSLSAVAGVILFTLAWFILGFLSPGYTLFGTLIAPYSAISQPISGLGLGPTAVWMNMAFVLCGLLLLAGVVGIFFSVGEISAVARWVCLLLFAMTPVGMIIDGLYTLEAMLVHLAGVVLATAVPVLGFLVSGLVLRGIPYWRQFSTWLLVASPITLVLVIVSFVTLDPEAAGQNIGVAGLVERILIVELLGTFAAMGWLAFRRR